MTGPPQPIGSNLPLASSLPKVSFRRVAPHEAQALAAPSGVADQQNVNFGFNDGHTFEQPEHYLRYAEPIEADLKRQVEYDMDEQDKEWLDAVNAERKREQLDTVTYELFEIIVDRLEKEWFDLMKRVPPKLQAAAIGPDGEPVSGMDDTECAICDDGECENSNAIVFCDGCNLAVHQDCYGIPYIPEGQWLCRKCTVSPDRAVSCVLCPNEGGAFKQTTLGKWAHLLCAMWIPETGVSNPVYMEPIDSVERIPKARWKLQCYLCRHRHGACIQCDNKACFTAFHVTCARKAGLLVKAHRQRASAHGNHASQSDGDDDDGGAETLKAMCHKHLPLHLRRKIGPSLAVAANGYGDEAADDDDLASSTRGSTPILPSAKPASRKITIRRGANGAISAVVAPPSATKSARAYKKSYRAGPPLVPSFIVNGVLEYIGKISLRRKQALVTLIAKFWSLKREARRGAPLLKRLHLEPWTANTAPQEMTEGERLQKLQFTLHLREDLERLRMLAELMRKREREKLRQMELVRKNLVEGVLFPFHPRLSEALESISAFDRNNLFLSPVSRSEVPDYYDIIKEPMEWASIAGKITDYRYETVDEFIYDVNLVLSNAMLYNKPETAFHRNALRIQKAAAPILASLRDLRSDHFRSVLQLGGQQLEAELNARDLELEPPFDAVGLLQEYDDAKRSRAVAEHEHKQGVLGPANFIQDLLRQAHFVAKTEKQAQLEAEKERRRLGYLAAAETRRKNREERAAALLASSQNGDTADGLEGSRADGTPVRRSQRAALSTAGAEQQVDKLALELASDSLGAKDTFLRFENGWILPEGTRRHGRDRSSHPTKPTRASLQQSQDNAARTTAASPTQDASELQDRSGTADQAVRRSPRASSDVASAPLNNRLRERSQVHAAIANGPIEPGNKRRRESESGEGGQRGTPAKPARLQAQKGPDASPLEREPGRFVARKMAERSARSNSSPLTSEDEDTRTSNARSGPLPSRRVSRRQSTLPKTGVKSSAARISTSDDKTGSAPKYDVGTIVWGKLGGHPFFPAEIMPEDDEIVPEAVLEAKAAQPAPQNAGEKLHLLRFYDPSRSYGWVNTRFLRFLFEDEELDEKLLAAAKPGNQRSGVRKAVNMARSALQGTLED
ncbi:unnamed protein product [Parajaminaea phylloscopi]